MLTLVVHALIDIVSRSLGDLFRSANFVALFIPVVRLFSGRIQYSGVVVGVEVLRLPIFADESSGLGKVSCEVDVFFAALNFSFESTTSLTPLLEELLSLFIPTFVCELLVLGVEPHLLEFLFSRMASGVVVLVV